jgi:hypothetical protein
MSNDKANDAHAKELTTTTTRSAVAGILAAFVGQPPEVIVATALAQFIPYVAGIAFGVAWNAKKAAADRWWAELLRELAQSEG